jgi:hypothetical protein
MHLNIKHINSSKSYTGWGVYEILLVFILIFSSCEKKEAPPAKPSVTIQQATNVTITSATLAAVVVPNEDGTTVAFEYKNQSGATWSSVPVSGTFSGSDSVLVSLNLSNLTKNTEYVVRVKATTLVDKPLAPKLISGHMKLLTLTVIFTTPLLSETKYGW